MSTAIQDAIAAAQNAAAASVPATVHQQSTAVATPAGRAPAFSIDDFGAGSINVDMFLKVKEHGLLIGDDPGLIEEVFVQLDMTEVQITEVVKFGNPAVYLKTLDGVSCLEGGSWEAAKARAAQVDPRARPYRSADLPMVLIEPAKDMKGKTIVDKGVRLGHSLSTTNRGNFQALLKDITLAGLDPTSDTVNLRITSEPRTNKNGNRWGVLKFELLDSPEE